MKDWPAYLDLKKKIDDFNDSCPLLELMANKVTKHLEKINFFLIALCSLMIGYERQTLEKNGKGM